MGDDQALPSILAGSRATVLLTNSTSIHTILFLSFLSLLLYFLGEVVGGRGARGREGGTTGSINSLYRLRPLGQQCQALIFGPSQLLAATRWRQPILILGGGRRVDLSVVACVSRRPSGHTRPYR